MAQRSVEDVGALVRARRLAIGLSQEGVPGVSSSTVRKIENGTAEAFRRSSIIAFMRAIRWPEDAMERLAAGDDPSALDVSAEDAPTDSVGDELLVAVRELTAAVRDLRARLDRGEL